MTSLTRACCSFPLTLLLLHVPIAAGAETTEDTTVADAPTDEASGVEGSIDLTAASLYVWRGFRATEDEPVLQPALSVSFDGVSVGMWANWELLDGNRRQAEFSEVDLWLEYAHAFGDLGVSVGAIEYLFPEGGLSTREAYLGVSWDAVVAPSLTVFYDLGEVDGSYSLLAVESSHTLSDSLSVGGVVSVGFGDAAYNRAYWGVDKAAPNDLNVGVNLPWQVDDRLTVTPVLQATMLLDSEISDRVEDADGKAFTFLGAVTSSWSF